MAPAGDLLAKAQLGEVTAALKVPGLFERRQKKILESAGVPKEG